MQRKLAGRSPGADQRHPSGTLLCLHVSKPGSDGPDYSPPPLGCSSSSPCRRLGYIVTEGPATTSNPYMHMGRQPQRDSPLGGPLLPVPTRVHCLDERRTLPFSTSSLGGHQKPVGSRLGYAVIKSLSNGPPNHSGLGRPPARGPAQDPPGVPTWLRPSVRVSQTRITKYPPRNYRDVSSHDQF